MKLYIAMVNDRHTDPEPFVFDNAEAAIEFARKKAMALCQHPETLKEETILGWIFYIKYSCESDCIWVLEKELNGDNWR